MGEIVGVGGFGGGSRFERAKRKGGVFHWAVID